MFPSVTKKIVRSMVKMEGKPFPISCTSLAVVLYFIRLVSFGSCMDVFTSEGKYYKTNLNLEEVPRDIPETAIEVYLRDNRIMQLITDEFLHLSQCRIVNLRDNSIVWIEEGAFRGLGELMRLNLKNNRIHELSSGIWEGLQSLNYLDLSGNNVDALPDGCFSRLSNLLELYLDRNKLTVISKTMFAKLSNLTTLYLSRNSIHTVESGSFSDLVQLMDLRLEGNSLTVIQADMLIGLESLKWLFLYNNTITDIKKGAFRSLLNIEDIDLTNNRLSTLNEDIFCISDHLLGHPSRLTLRLAQNSFICTNNMCWLREAEQKGWMHMDTFLALKCTNFPSVTWSDVKLDCSNLENKTDAVCLEPETLRNDKGSISTAVAVAVTVVVGGTMVVICIICVRKKRYCTKMKGWSSSSSDPSLLTISTISH